MTAITASITGLQSGVIQDAEVREEMLAVIEEASVRRRAVFERFDRQFQSDADIVVSSQIKGGVGSLYEGRPTTLVDPN